MSEPITWRSISAPNFGSSAAIMNSGNESMNQGINSLANLAKGYVDEQKGIAVSNAVAALSNTTNDADRSSVFNAHAANLKDHGIDLKDLITASQAQHKTIQGDEAFKASQELAASNLKGNVLEQAGQGIKNLSEQGLLDYQKTDQAQKTAAADLGIRVGDSTIATNAAQLDIARSNAASNALSASASAEHSRAATKALGDAAVEKERGRTAALTYDKIANDPRMLSLNSATGKQEVDQNKVHDAYMANGGNPLEYLIGKKVYEGMAETDKHEAALAKIAANTREDTQIAAEQANKISVAKENHKEKPLSAIDFNSRASEVAKSLTWGWGFMDKSTLEGQIKTLASSVGQAKAMSIVGDSLGSDGNIDFVKLNTNIGKASLQKTASEDKVSNPN